MYPAVLFVVCLGAISVFALFIGPRFESIFNEMKVELPLITRVLLGAFRFIKSNFLFVLMGIGGFLFLFKKWTRTRFGRLQMEKFIFGLPSIGHVYKLIIVERFSSQMAILVDSGVPILHALDIAQRLVDNVSCANVIGDIKESVRQGELLVAPMERSKFFPGMAIQMINVGEETGELSKMLKHVAAFYQETVETFMKRLGTIIEPFMLVFMGAVIGVIVLAMFLPLFNIAQLGGGG
jgi:type IV pilus assembly protein PilC